MEKSLKPWDDSYYLVEGVKHGGTRSNILCDMTGICGDVSDIRGDVTDIRGDITDIINSDTADIYWNSW